MNTAIYLVILILGYYLYAYLVKKNRMKEIDQVLIDTIKENFPEYENCALDIRGDQLDEKYTESWIRFIRFREDKLYECIQLARELEENGLYNYQFEFYIDYLPNLEYISKTGENFTLSAVIPKDSIYLLGEPRGSGCYALGKTKSSCKSQLQKTITLFKQYGTLKQRALTKKVLEDNVIKNTIDLLVEFPNETQEVLAQKVSANLDIGYNEVYEKVWHVIAYRQDPEVWSQFIKDNKSITRRST